MKSSRSGRAKDKVVVFRELLGQALGKRSRLLQKTDALRVADGVEDGFPGLAIDRYGECFQLQFFGPDLLGQRGQIVEAARQILSPRFLVTKLRLSPSGKALETPEMIVEIGEASGSKTVVREGNCRFAVDLLDTVNPGLFLDMRKARFDVEARSRGKEILNLFSYTCSFAVHARLGGAVKAVNADISAKVLEKGRENYQLNGIEPVAGEFFRGDVREYLGWCVRKGKKFDGVVFDPPSFSRNRGRTFSVRTDFQEIVSEICAVLSPGAFLLASSNFAGFSPKGLAADTIRTVHGRFPSAKVAWSRGQDEDFPGSGKRSESSLSAVMVEI